MSTSSIVVSGSLQGGHNSKGNSVSGSHRGKRRENRRKARRQLSKRKKILEKFKIFQKLNQTENLKTDGNKKWRMEKKDPKEGTNRVYSVTMAPFNTTQFLMEDRNLQEPDYAKMYKRRHRRYSSDSTSTDYYSSPDDEEDFQEKNFKEVYEAVQTEHLSKLSKDELVDRYLNLEDQMDKMAKDLKVAQAQRVANHRFLPVNDLNGMDVEELEKVMTYKEDLEKLSVENETLEMENEKLRFVLSRHRHL